MNERKGHIAVAAYSYLQRKAQQKAPKRKPAEKQLTLFPLEPQFSTPELPSPISASYDTYDISTILVESSDGAHLSDVIMMAYGATLLSYSRSLSIHGIYRCCFSDLVTHLLSPSQRIGVCYGIGASVSSVRYQPFDGSSPLETPDSPEQRRSYAIDYTPYIVPCENYHSTVSQLRCVRDSLDFFASFPNPFTVSHIAVAPHVDTYITALPDIIMQPLLDGMVKFPAMTLTKGMRQAYVSNSQRRSSSPAPVGYRRYQYKNHAHVATRHHDGELLMRRTLSRLNLLSHR